MNNIQLQVWSATWCVNCKTLKHNLDVNGIDYTEKLCDDVQVAQEGREAGIRTLPTVFVIKDGKVIDRIVGLQPISKYINATQNVHLEHDVDVRNSLNG